jgi:ribonucleoside-diphosphate reductase alpha chain
VIKQGGARRGANMGILSIDHPDILEFIKIKRDARELRNFNISVSVTDAFMEALRRDGDYELFNPRTKTVYRRIRARDVFDEIVESAWETGDPGIVFIDAINRANPTPHIGRMESTNPCGEQPLLPNEACVLGSINLDKYVTKKAGRTAIDFTALSEDIATAVRFLDDTIDINKYPLSAIEAMHKGNRKIGLGVMGWADMLISLGVPYDSPKAFNLAENFMKFFRDRTRECSADLADKRGVFPNFKGSIYDEAGMPAVRNATTTTIAPTGTLSIIADCSSGIEPLFALAYKRLIMDTELVEMNRHFFETAKELGFYSEDLEEKIVRQGTLRGIREVPVKIRRLYKTAHEINYADHIEVQARFQKYTDNAVSKTINLPKGARKEDVAGAYLLAYEKGCKGVTVFRYGAQKRGTLVRFPDAD